MRIDTQAIQHGLKQTSRTQHRQTFFVPPVRRFPGIIPLKGSKQSAMDERIAATSLMSSEQNSHMSVSDHWLEEDGSWHEER